MPFQLFRKSEQEFEEERETLAQAREKLGHLVSEQALYAHPAWPYFQARLLAIESSAMESLIGCPPSEVETIRERIKLARHLAEVPQSVEAERARLQAELTASEGE